MVSHSQGAVWCASAAALLLALVVTCTASEASRQSRSRGGFHSAWVHVLMVFENYLLLATVRFLGQLCYGPTRDVEWGVAPQPAMVHEQALIGARINM